MAKFELLMRRGSLMKTYITLFALLFEHSFFMCNVQPYKCMGCHKAIVMITVGHIVFILHTYIYISYILYVRIYANFLRNAIVGLSNPWIGDSQDQETVLAPFADKQAHYYDTDCLYNISIWIIPEEATFKLCQVIKLITGTDHSYYR